ncbi:MAG: Brp/Blh family beta-carotene 15,15'-dioxygenase [Bacteroidetes bacterium]|nr:Brp/Blh family beta-carotene 15,15'-dioxygenase [Bacteroidota bacterium]
MARIEYLFKALGLGITLLFLLFPNLPQEIQFLIFSVILLLVGIPHGGIDHLIHNPEIRPKGLFHFILRYLLLMLGYGLLWWLLPLAALIAFLGLSAYHFGQSHFLEQGKLQNKEGWLYLLKGAFFLAVILFGDWKMTQEILSSIVNLQIDEDLRLAIVGILMVSSLVVQGFTEKTFGLGDGLDYLVLVPMLYFSPLLISFSVYFGFWHSLPSMLAEYSYLQKLPAFNSPLKFGRQLLPFSAISLLGIGAIFYFGMEFLDSNQLYLLFFVMISLISLPHILYMDTFLKEKFQN